MSKSKLMDFLKVFKILLNYPVCPLTFPLHFRQYYLTDVHWVDENRILAVWLRRIQNSSIVSVCKISDSGWSCKKVRNTLFFNGSLWEFRCNFWVVILRLKLLLKRKNNHIKGKTDSRIFK